MNYQDVIIPSVDSYPLAVRVYNCENAKAIIKIIHGMEEHQSRYEDIASFFVENGYMVVTADLRGHGKSAPKLSHIADKDGDKLLISDEKVIREFISDEFPDLPVYLYCHSMGSIIARVLLQTDSQKYSKVILSGFPNYVGAVKLGKMISSFLRGTKGPQSYAKILTNLTLGQYTKAIPNCKTKLDWLTVNEDNIIAYDKDPLSGEEFTIASYDALMSLMVQMNKTNKCKNIKADLPLFLCCGEQDPCVGGQKGIDNSVKMLKKYGFNKIDVKVFENMRHEIHNEKDNKKVYQAYVNFFNKK